MNAKYDIRLTPITRLIYADLLLRCNYGSRPSKATDSEFALMHGISERSVRRSIKTLINSGYLCKDKVLDKRYLYIVKE